MNPGTINRKIDSHSSARNNERLIQLLTHVDKTALKASKTEHYNDIYEYIQAIEQAYINTKDAIISDKVKLEIETLRKAIYDRIDMIHSDTRQRGFKSIQFLIRSARAYNSLLITGLQSGEFFFRTGKRTEKGLNTNFFFDNIFNTKKNTGSEENEFL